MAEPNERRAFSGRYLGNTMEPAKKPGGKDRYVFRFENKASPDYSHKITAFAPLCNLENLKVGTAYEGMEELVPMPNGQGNFHNFARKERDGDFLIKEAGIESEPIGEKPKPAQPQTPKPAQPNAAVFTSDNYWRNKDKRDLENDRLRKEQWEAGQAGMRWGNSINAAAVAVAAMIEKGLLRDGKQASDAIITLARDLEQTGPAKKEEKSEAAP